MARQIDFYFDFPSPYGYLASTQLAAVATAAGAGVAYRPMRLLEVMKLVGNRPTTVESPAKFKYAQVDLRRWAARYRVPFQLNPNMRGFDYAALGRGALVAIDEGRGADYVNAIYGAVWGGSLNLAERPVLSRLLDGAGFDGARLLEKAAQADYVAKLDAATAAAAERGVFGSPTMVVGNEMFFGNDRLEWVGAALSAPP